MDKTNHKILIIYKSKYGSTKQYAEWIANEVKSNLILAKNIDNQSFVNYDIIIFGGYFYMDHINIANLIIKNWDALKNKKIILFTTSGTPPTSNFIKKIYNSDFPDNIRRTIKYFPLRGKLDINKLTFFDKFLMMTGKIITRDPAIKKMMGTGFNGVRKENLTPLLKSVKKEL